FTKLTIQSVFPLFICISSSLWGRLSINERNKELLQRRLIISDPSSHSGRPVEGYSLPKWKHWV
ncbi:hypothetical protein, partial [Salmonella sp. s54412]|uniref:hypothetical protein n=1 Tax=Salmonella sp. s54412 TaxID=3160128 RepID=UPI003754E70A